jgi:Flp pilus assembly protein TadG
MATKSIKLKDITGTLTDTNRLKNAAAAAAGLAATGHIENQAFRALPDIFGTNTGAGSLTATQQVARHGLRAAEVVAGLLFVAKGKGMARPFGYGMAAGGTWHIAREVAPVLNPS